MRPVFASIIVLATLGAGSIRIEPGVPQLFVDDAMIESAKDVQRTLHQPIKDNGGNEPIIALADELNGTPATLEANGSIVFDPRLKKYVMFAIAFSSSAQSDRVRLYRFTSPDGMKWIKGDDGKPQRIDIDLLDPVSGKRASSIDLFSCFYDTRDEKFPYKGWVWLANFEREGIYFLRSRDGRTWERGEQVAKMHGRKIEQDGRVLVGPSDVSIFSYDAVTNRFLALLKFNSTSPVEGSWLRSRAYMFFDRLDRPLDLNAISRVALVPAAAARNGDLPADEYYASTAWRYGSIWLGGLKVWHRTGDYPYSAAGSAFLKLAVSRDGLDWHKVSFGNEVFIPNGAEGGSNARNDGGYITEFSQGPLHIGDELIYYYGCSSFGKNHPADRRVSGGGIFRARLRVDGFVSVDSGTLTTRPFTCDGSKLLLNSTGAIDVDLLDASGTTFGSADVRSDANDHAVTFGSKTFGELARGSVRLRFKCGDGARLYSFTIR